VLASRDNDVIDERDSDDARCCRHGVCEGDVFFARRRVSARVVVHQHEAARPLAERDAKRIACHDMEPVQAARGDPARGP
jgi:hypothetical protein